MARAYLVMADAGRLSGGPDPMELNTVLQGADMQLRSTSATFAVYTSDETPTLHLPGGGIVVGDLHTRSGTAIRHASQLPAASSAAALRRHILKNCWGDYILILPEANDPRSVGITRSPSPACDLQCVYSLEEGTGFLTSHITLAERLGLCRRRVDFEQVAHQLAYPGLKTARTCLAGIRELLPGCTIHLHDGTARASLDWNPWEFVDAGSRPADPHEAASSVRDAIETVVHAWAEQDGSILLELSGGLDSSIVGACLRESRARVTCLTLTTPVPGADEREYAGLVAGMLGVGLQAQELRYGDAPYRFPLPPDIVTPVIGPLQYAVDRTMQAIADRESVDSHFTGGGGDTVFGYLMNAAPAADAFLGAGLVAGIRAVRDISAFHQCTYWKAARLTLRKLRTQGEPHGIDRSFLPPRTRVPEPEPHPWLSPPARFLPGDRQRILELSATQFFRDSCPRALVRRLRMPLLSQPVVEACLRVPSWMWFHGGQNRAVARLGFAHALPPRILARKSKGTFTAYLGALYRRELAGMLAFLLHGQLEAHGLLDGDKLRALAKGEMPRGDNAFMRIFQLCALENWVRQQSPPGGPVHR